MKNCYNSETSKILKVAEKEMLSCHHPYVGTEHLLLSLLKNKNISKICYKYNLNYYNYKKNLLKIIGIIVFAIEVIYYLLQIVRLLFVI